MDVKQRIKKLYQGKSTSSVEEPQPGLSNFDRIMAYWKRKRRMKCIPHLKKFSEWFVRLSHKRRVAKGARDAVDIFHRIDDQFNERAYLNLIQERNLSWSQACQMELDEKGSKLLLPEL